MEKEESKIKKDVRPLSLTLSKLTIEDDEKQIFPISLSASSSLRHSSDSENTPSSLCSTPKHTSPFIYSSSFPNASSSSIHWMSNQCQNCQTVGCDRDKTPEEFCRHSASICRNC